MFTRKPGLVQEELHDTLEQMKEALDAGDAIDPTLLQEAMEHIEELEVQAHSLSKRPGKAPKTLAGMLSLAGRAKQRQRKLLRESRDLARFLARAWLWPPQSEEPL